MAAELVPLLSLRSRDKGSYFVPMYKLIDMSFEDLNDAESIIQDLIAANPDYEFECIDERALNGITIRWRKI